MAKAYAWIYKIRPHLAQTYDDEQAAEYLIALMPRRLGSDARRIFDKFEENGTLGNLMQLARELEKVVYRDQSAPPPAAALVQLDVELAAKFDSLTLSEMTGMAFAAPSSGQTGGGRSSRSAARPSVKLLFGVGGKWCSDCGKHENCFFNPQWPGPLPVFIHESTERKKIILKGRADNAKGADPPVQCVPLKAPPAEAIKAYKERRKAGRGAGRGARAGGVAAEGTPGGAALDWYSTIEDITDVSLAGMCHEGIFDDAEEDSEVQLMASEGGDSTGDAFSQWFVVKLPDGSLEVQAALDTDSLELAEGSAYLAFGGDEAAARAYVSERVAAVSQAAPQTAPPQTPARSSKDFPAPPRDTPVPLRGGSTLNDVLASTKVVLPTTCSLITGSSPTGVGNRASVAGMDLSDLRPTPPPPLDEEDETEGAGGVLGGSAVESCAANGADVRATYGLKPTPPPPLDEGEVQAVAPTDRLPQAAATPEPPQHVVPARAVKKTVQSASPDASEKWVEVSPASEPSTASDASEIASLKAQLAQYRSQLEVAARSPGGTTTDAYEPLAATTPAVGVGVTSTNESAPLASGSAPAEQPSMWQLGYDLAGVGVSASQHALLACGYAAKAIAPYASAAVVIAPAITAAAATATQCVRRAATPERTVLLAFVLVGISVGLAVRRATD